MIDLRNLGGGKKFIKKLIGITHGKHLPWSKQTQYESVKKNKNSYSPNFRPKNFF